MNVFHDYVLHSDQPGACLAPGRGYVDSSGKKNALQKHGQTHRQTLELFRLD